METEVTVEFNEKEAILEVRIGSYDEIIKNGRLEDEFLNRLFEGYQAVESSEKKKAQKRHSPLKKFREAVRKNKKEYELPVKEIYLYPSSLSNIKSEYIRDVIIKSIGLESEYYRVMADRWELFEDLAVGIDLLIDISAVSVGVYRYITTGEIKEGFVGFGYLATIGMALLIVYFILRIVGEEPCKRKSRYLTHMLTTPTTLYRTHPSQTQITFSAHPEETAPDAV